MFAEHVLHEVGTNRHYVVIGEMWPFVKRLFRYSLCLVRSECDLSLTWIWVMMVMMTTIMARK